MEALDSLDTPVVDAQAEMEQLLSETTQLAERHLNRACNQLLIPLWRRLSGALQNHPFDPSRPDLHPSYTAAQARDWPGARQAVEREADWQHQPLLLERHARACTHLADQAAALHSWYLLCWRFPRLSDRLDSCGDRSLSESWRTFLDLEPELPAEEFPAWLLLHLPGLAAIAPDGDGDIPCPDSYRTLYHLQRNRQQATDEQAMELRARLKQQAPQLFRYFLASREKP